MSCALQTLSTRVKKKEEEEEEEEEDTLPADIFVLWIVHFLSTFSTELFRYSRQTSQK